MSLFDARSSVTALCSDSVLVILLPKKYFPSYSRRLLKNQIIFEARMQISYTIPSLAGMGLFSALAFLGAHKFDGFIKLMLFNLIIMAEPTERRSKRSRKPIVHFDDRIAQSLGPSKSSRAPKPTANPTAKPLKPPATASASTEPSILDLVKQLCSQTEELDIEEDPKA